MENRGRLTNGNDGMMLDDDGAVDEDSAAGVHGDDGGIVEYGYCLFHHRGSVWPLCFTLFSDEKFQSFFY